MNYYRELNEGLNKYINYELREEDNKECLNEDTQNKRSFLGKSPLNEANPFRAIKNVAGKVSNAITTKKVYKYLFDGKELNKKSFYDGISFYDLKLTPKQSEQLEQGTELKIKGNDGKEHTIQIQITKTDKTDRKNAEEASKNVDSGGNLSDEGKLSVEEIKATSGNIQYALVLGGSKRLALYPSYSTLEQALTFLIDSFTQLKPTNKT